MLSITIKSSLRTRACTAGVRRFLKYYGYRKIGFEHTNRNGKRGRVLEAMTEVPLVDIYRSNGIEEALFCIQFLPNPTRRVLSEKVADILLDELKSIPFNRVHISLIEGKSFEVCSYEATIIRQLWRMREGMEDGGILLPVRQVAAIIAERKYNNRGARMLYKKIVEKILKVII